MSVIPGVLGNAMLMEVDGPHFENVNKGSKSWAKLSNGPTYEWMEVETNIPPAGIEYITLEMNGSYNLGEIINIKGEHLNMLHDYRGLPGVHKLDSDPVYRYIIHLSSMESATPGGEVLSGLVTLTNDNNIFSVKIAENADVVDKDGVATAPYIKLHPWATPSRESRRLVPIIKSQSLQNNATGWFDHMNLPDGAGMHYRRLFIKGDIREVEIIQDDVRRFKAKADSNRVAQILAGREPQDGFFVVDFIRTGFALRDMFKPQNRKALALKMDMATADNITILYEGVQALAKWQTENGEVVPGSN